MENIQNITPGECVWVIVRDEIGEPYDVNGYIFLAQVAGAAIVTPYINDLESLEDILMYHIEETAKNNDPPLAVFPLDDCYESKADAEVDFNLEFNVISEIVVYGLEEAEYENEED